MVPIVAAVVLTGCGSSPINAARIENALAPTFANLVHLQVTWLGLPPVAASTFDVTANCQRPATGTRAGAGEWRCTVRWLGPERQRLRDSYDVFVNTDGCYTATAEGDSLGGPTLKAPDGREVRNLLRTFDGCFDTL